MIGTFLLLEFSGQTTGLSFLIFVALSRTEGVAHGLLKKKYTLNNIFLFKLFSLADINTLSFLLDKVKNIRRYILSNRLIERNY